MSRAPALRAAFSGFPVEPNGVRKLVVDLFAGGGGTSEGIDEALGFSPDIAANHDREAVAMHQVNHPRTKHYIEDVRKLDIPKVCAGRKVGLLWLSPDCKHHSIAKGSKPVDRKIRGLAWEAVRWAREARPDVIILENVKEFRGWGPVRRADNMPCPIRKGVTYRQFQRQLEALGYVVEDRNLRACDYGAPTSRERLFLVARRDGRPIVWPAPTHAEGGKGGLKPWRTAAECIDFTLPCHSIFLTKDEGRAVGVKRPLADNTMARVGRGTWKYVENAAEPFVVRFAHGEAGPNSVRWGRGEHSLDDPMPTLAASREFGVVQPFIAGVGGRKGQSNETGVAQPFHTITAKADSALLVPLLMKNMTNNEPRSADSPASTVLTGNHHFVVAPTLITVGYGEREGQAPRSLDIEAPIGTLVGTKKHGVVAAFLAQHNGGFYDQRGGEGRLVDAPMSTITQAGSNQQLVAASVVKLKGTSKDGQAIDTPLHTVQAGGNHYGQVCAFLMRYHGTGGQWGKVNAPAPTVVSHDSIALVYVQKQPYVIVDIGMRMFTPRELFRCQGFSDTYIINPIVEKGGVAKPLSATAQVRMVGNSVPPQFARALVEAQFAVVEERRAA